MHRYDILYFRTFISHDMFIPDKAGLEKMDYLEFIARETTSNPKKGRRGDKAKIIVILSGM